MEGKKVASIGEAKLIPEQGNVEGKPAFFDSIASCMEQMKKEYVDVNILGNPAFQFYDRFIVPEKVSVSEDHLVLFKRRQKSSMGAEWPTGPCDDAGLPKFTKESTTYNMVGRQVKEELVKPDWGEWRSACSGAEVSLGSKSKDYCKDSRFPGGDERGSCNGYLVGSDPEKLKGMIEQDIKREILANEKDETTWGRSRYRRGGWEEPSEKVKTKQNRIKVEYKVERHPVSKQGFTCKLFIKKNDEMPKNFVKDEIKVPEPTGKNIAFFNYAESKLPFMTATRSTSGASTVKDLEGNKITPQSKISTSEEEISLDKESGKWINVEDKKVFLVDERVRSDLVGAGFQRGSNFTYKHVGNDEKGIPHFCVLMFGPVKSDMFVSSESDFPRVRDLSVLDQEKSGIYISHGEKKYRLEDVDKDMMEGCNSMVSRISDSIVRFEDYQGKELELGKIVKMFEKKKASS